MNVDEYLSKRVNTQIEWYELKGKRHKRIYILLRLSELVVSALIPLIIVFQIKDSASRIITACLGFVITVATGILTLLKFQENWIEYMKTAQVLKREKYLFVTKSIPYSGEDSFSIFVDTIEGVILKENSNWAEYQTEVKSK